MRGNSPSETEMDFEHPTLEKGKGEGFRKTHLSRPVVRLCIYALIMAPLLLSLLYIKTYGVNVVYGDEWSFVPFIEKFYSGTLTLGDLFRNHNEHKMFFPRIIMLILARLTHYNTIAEMYCSWVLIVLTLALIYKMYKSDFGDSSFALLKFAPIPWLLLSLRQSESFLWGFELLMYLCVAGVVAAIYLLEKPSRYAFAGAICCGILASFSSVNGLLTWPVGIAFILLSNKKNKLRALIPWTLIGIFVWVLYLYDWTRLSGNPSISFVFKKPITALTFLVVNTGSPLAFVKSSALGMGAAMIVFIIAALAIAAIEGVRENAKWMALILFSFSSSILFTTGRASYGFWAALASRYFIFTVIGAIAVYMSFENYYHNAGDPRQKQKYGVLYGAVLSIILVGIISGYASGVVLGRETRDARKLMAERLINYRQTNDKQLEIVFYDMKMVRERAEFMEKYGLNVFHKPIPSIQKVSN